MTSIISSASETISAGLANVNDSINVSLASEQAADPLDPITGATASKEEGDKIKSPIEEKLEGFFAHDRLADKKELVEKGILKDDKVSPFALTLRFITLLVVFYGWKSLPDLELTEHLERMMGEVRELQNLQHLLFLVALPVEIIVSIVYWPLTVLACFILPCASSIIPLLPDSQVDQRQTPFSLVFLLDHPGAVVLPRLPDLALHLIPTLLLLADFLSSNIPPRLRSRPSSARIVLGVLGTAYGAFLEHCFLSNPIFPYPFLSLSPFPLRLVIYALATYGSIYISEALRARKEGSPGKKRSLVISRAFDPIHLTHVAHNKTTGEWEWALTMQGH